MTIVIIIIIQDASQPVGGHADEVHPSLYPLH